MTCIALQFLFIESLHRVYLSEEEDLFSVIFRDDAEDLLAFQLHNMEYSCNDAAFSEKQMNVTVPERLQQNGSYWAHMFEPTSSLSLSLSLSICLH